MSHTSRSQPVPSIRDNELERRDISVITERWTPRHEHAIAGENRFRDGIEVNAATCSPGGSGA
jgi:hypothetical protein